MPFSKKVVLSENQIVPMIAIYVFGYISDICTSRMPHKVNCYMSLISLNSDFLFSETGRYTKFKEPKSVPLFPIATVKIVNFQNLLALCEVQTNLVQDLNSSFLPW